MLYLLRYFLYISEIYIYSASAEYEDWSPLSWDVPLTSGASLNHFFQRSRKEKRKESTTLYIKPSLFSSLFLIDLLDRHSLRLSCLLSLQFHQSQVHFCTFSQCYSFPKASVIG